MTPINDPAARREAAAAVARLDRVDAEIASHRRELGELSGTLAQLRDRLTAEQAGAPQPDEQLEEAAADALLADPNASGAKGILARANHAFRTWRDAKGAHDLSLSPLRRAITKAESRITDLEGDIERLTEEREAAHVEQVRAVHRALVGELERRARLLADEILAPMTALEFERTPKNGQVVFGNGGSYHAAVSFRRDGRMQQVIPMMVSPGDPDDRMGGWKRSLTTLLADLRKA